MIDWLTQLTERYPGVAYTPVILLQLFVSGLVFFAGLRLSRTFKLHKLGTFLAICFRTGCGLFVLLFLLDSIHLGMQTSIGRQSQHTSPIWTIILVLSALLICIPCLFISPKAKNSPIASEASAEHIRETFLTDKIEWIEPKEITELRLREETLPGLQKMLRQCTRYFLMASIPLVALGYFVNGFGFSILALSLLTLMIYQVPFLIWMNIRQSRKSGVRYRVNLKGIQVNQRFYIWRQIEGYNFSDAVLVPESASLNIKLLPHKEWTSLSFYRQEIDEQELRAVLERFVSQAD